jgi:phosphomannomutase
MGKLLSELSKEYKKYFHSGEINFKVKDQQEVLQNIENRYKNCKIEKIDGLSVYCNKWWFNVRLSNTEPLLRLNLEADNKELMNEKIEEVKGIIKH